MNHRPYCRGVAYPSFGHPSVLQRSSFKPPRPSLPRTWMLRLSECSVFVSLVVAVFYLASLWQALNPFESFLSRVEQPKTAIERTTLPLLAEQKVNTVFIEVHTPD